MEENVTIGTYKEKETKVFLKKIIVLGLIIILISTFFIFKACTRKTNEEKILLAAKEYYKKYSSVLPKDITECKMITLNDLISKQLLSNPQTYSVCDRKKSYVKVCKLENESYHYTPIIVCNDDKDTKFNNFKEGKEKDIVTDKSDIRFLYIPEINTNKTKLYYPDNKNISEIKELYDKEPTEEHIFKEKNSYVGYKWYSTDSGTNYWNNGGFTSEQPDGYDKKGDEGTPVKNISIEKPEEKEYRTIENVKLYRYKELKKPSIHSYSCVDKQLNGAITSKTKCEDRPQENYKITQGIYYTCDGTKIVSQGTTCGGTNWSNYSTNKCTATSNIECNQINGYLYTDKVWKWYISGDFRKYYPSGSASAIGEITYYEESPAEGYIKDEDSKKKVYKYFKLSDETSEQTSWVQIGNKYMNLEDLLETYKKYGFEVGSINDVVSNKNTRFKIKLEIRNRR